MPKPRVKIPKDVAIARGFVAELEGDATERLSQYSEYGDFYEGGERVKKYLAKHPSEKPAEYQLRKDQMADMNYSAPLADQIINSFYGGTIERRVIDDEKATERLDEIYNESQIGSLQRDYGNGQVVYGDGHTRIWFDEVDDLTRIQYVSPGNVFVLPSSRDALTPDILVEKRAFEYDGFRRWPRTEWLVWTNDEYAVILEEYGDSTNKAPMVTWKTPPSFNPYGIIPYAHWKGIGRTSGYWGKSAIRSVITLQKMVNNRTSKQDRVIAYQTHGQWVIYSDDEIKLVSGEARFMPLGQNDRAEILDQKANIEGAQQTIENMIDRMAEIGRVPVSAIRGGSANSGFQLVMEFVPMTHLRSSYIERATVAEDYQMWAVSRVGHVHSQGTPDELGKVEITFPESFLPVDKNEDFLRDTRLVQMGDLKRSEYIRKWVGKGRWDEGETEKYIQDLDEENGQQQQPEEPEEEPRVDALANL
jgi:hypothetical protein